jgi:maltose O-acetyltransferase
MGIKNLFRRYVLKVSQDEIDLEELKKRGLTVGEETYIYSVGSIDHIYPHLISIGRDVTISTNVTILAHDASTTVVKCGTKLGRVSIGDNVFIGTGTTILCNTKIGNNVVVGARSLVTCDLPDNGVYAGIPAKRICSIEDFRERNKALRKARPDFSEIKPWYEWTNATEQERQAMIDGLQDGIGFI